MSGTVASPLDSDAVVLDIYIRMHNDDKKKKEC